MGTGLRLNKKQILFLLLVLLSLLFTTAIVLHAITPSLFHEVAFRPEIIYRH
jgi:hypothetical protein